MKDARRQPDDWKDMLGRLPDWLKGGGPDEDVVVSSRVRLARNVAGFPFVARADRSRRQELLELCKSVVQPAVRGLWIELAAASAIDRTILVERHLISQQHARGKQAGGGGGGEEPRAVAIAMPHQRVSVMVNEEDHLRVQVVGSGMCLRELLDESDRLDDTFESSLDYAYSPRFGYLTACPTNVGSGIRLSAMLHLPALRMVGNIDKVKRAAADMSLAVRGFYGEGSEAAGDFYQVSNQTTLGKSERVLLQDLAGQIIPKVIDYERAARKTLMTKRRALVEDQVFRALGLLTSARLLTTEEGMQLLSQVRLGVALGLITHVELRVLHELILLTQPAHLQRVVGETMDQDKRRAARANLVRGSTLAQN